MTTNTNNTNTKKKFEMDIITIQTFESFGGTRLIEAQFQIEAPDPYPLNKRRTDLGMLVVLSRFRFSYMNAECT